jgi:flagellar L-ring protein precursor FlgH
MLVLALSLAGCNTFQKLSEIGRPPAMTATADPTLDPKWRPVTMPMPRAEITPREPASLWRTGSRAFFKDQRAAQVGDIITILVNTTDAADVENASVNSRTGTESMGLPNLFGLEASLPKLLGKAVSPSALVNANSSNASNGTGTIKRNETVTLRLAGVVTQVLPNGNLVVAARQEMRVNSELRELQAGYRQRQHRPPRPLGRSTHLVWRPRPADRYPNPEIWPTSSGCSLTLLKV